MVDASGFQSDGAVLDSDKGDAAWTEEEGVRGSGSVGLGVGVVVGVVEVKLVSFPSLESGGVRACKVVPFT